MIPANFVPTILRHKNLESTNATARELAQKGAAEGTIVLAETQTGGRGRGKRVWHSPPGGLYLSTLVYPKDPKRPTDLALLAGVAMAQTVREIMPKSTDVSVKWPNDLLVGWKKAGGVLCESLGEDYFHFCVVGMGINVNLTRHELTPFLGNPFSATSLLVETEAGSPYDTEEILSVLVAKFFNLYRTYHKEGFAALQFIWEKNCQLIGKKVELRDSGWRDAEGPQRHDIGVTTGTFLGIDDSGAIVLSNAKGERRHYFSGEITCYWP